MQEFTAYKSDQGKAFQTPSACLRSEYDHLRETVIAWANALIILPTLDVDTQFQAFQAKIDEWHVKGREYHAALDAAQRPKPTNLEEFREEYQETILKTGSG